MKQRWIAASTLAGSMMVLLSMQPLWAADNTQSDVGGSGVGDIPSPTQSDVGGPGVGDSNQSDVGGPDVGTPTVIDSAIAFQNLDLLQSLVGNETQVSVITQLISNALNDAYVECSTLTDSGENQVINREACSRLNQLIEETRIFIDRQNQNRQNQQQPVPTSTPNRRLW